MLGGVRLSSGPLQLRAELTKQLRLGSLGSGAEGPARPARLSFTPPSADGDEVPPLTAQVISAVCGEEQGGRQLSEREGQLISSKVSEIYDPPRTKLCLLGDHKA